MPSNAGIQSYQRLRIRACAGMTRALIRPVSPATFSRREKGRRLIRPCRATPGSSPDPHPALRATFSQREKEKLRAGGGGQGRVGAVERGEHALEVRDLRQVVIDDVGIARILRQEVLVIILGAIE